MQWIVVNLFLLLLIGVGAGTFFVLGSGVKAMNLDSDVEPYFLAVVAVASIFASFGGFFVAMKIFFKHA